MPSSKTPKSLQNWFVVHFVIDIIFAIPLILAPEYLLPILGWTYVDPITTRLVGAALFGIGIESLLGRNARLNVFKAMLNLKILWSSAAIIGISIGIYMGAPIISWVILSIFALFFIIWTYYRITIFKK